MRHAWLLLALLAAPAIAQTPPLPGAGVITVGENLQSSADGFINATECSGSGVVHLAWRITGVFPTTGVTYKLFASNQATTGDCRRQDETGISLKANEVLPRITSTTLNPVTDATYATTAIVAAAGFGACDASAPQSIFLCAEGVDPNFSTTVVGNARGTLTLDRRVPATPAGVSARPGDEAVNVSFDLLPASSDPAGEYYLIDARPVGTTTAAFDPVAIHTSGPVTASPYRLGGLVNTVVYQVRVFAFSPADNRSLDPTYVVTAPALPSADFWEAYKAAGGREEGGCASGSAGLVGLAAAAALLLAVRRRRNRIIVAALLAVFATPARAESPRWGSFDVSYGNYKPNLDAEFSGTTARPFEGTFGDGRGWMFRVGLSKSLLTAAGTLEAGFQTGYHQKSGSAQNVDPTTGALFGASGDETTLHIIPTTVTLTYRFDFLADRYRIPLAPYGRVALERYNWWITDGSGSNAMTGATNGWSLTGGMALLLDVFDPGLARELDNESGVNHTYVFFEARKSSIDDFGSSKSWDLSDKRLSYAGGLLFVF